MKIYSLTIKFIINVSLMLISIFGLGQVTLTGTSYTQNFDNISSGLPNGWTVRTGAQATALGNPATLTTAATSWDNTTGAFKNLASADGLNSDSNAAAQSGSSDRALGVRQTGTFGDPGAAFILQLTNTMGFENFQLSFKLQSLDISSPRTTTWIVDYGIGTNPSAFQAVTTSPATITTGNMSFTNTTVTVNFGNALNNISQNVWIRIVTLTSTTGSGTRASTGVDDFVLTFQDSGFEETQVATPEFNPAPGIYYQTQLVSLITATEDAAIYYTLDGNTPDESSTLYTSPIEISESTTIKARGYRAGLDPSEIATGIYAIRTVVHNKNFEDESLTSGGWTTYSVASNKDWTIGSVGGGAAGSLHYAEINGYQQDVLSNDWLISPSIDFGDLTDRKLSFFTHHAFGNVLSELKLKYSINYTSGDPTSAVWTELSFTKPGTENTWLNSGHIEIPEIKADNIRFAFHYLGTSNPKRWRVDEIVFSGTESNITNADLAIFKVDDINLLSLSEIVVDDPELDEGATLLVADFSAIQGITVSTVNPMATFVVEKNAVVVDEVDFETLTFAEGDVLVVTVTAEDEISVKNYKVTLALDTREIVFVTPVGGEEYSTGDAVLIEWTSQGIDFLDLYVYQDGNSTPVAQYLGIDAADETFTDNLPNEAHGTYYFRLYDSSDNTFYTQSENVTFFDIQAPVFTELLPINGAVDVAVTTTLEIVFNEGILKNTGNIVIHKASDNSVVETINVTTAQVSIIDGHIAKITLNNALDYLTEFYILIASGVFEDAAGNPFAGITDSSVWSFTTKEETFPQWICNSDFELWTAGKPDCWFGSKTHTIDFIVNQYSTSAQSGNFAVQLINDVGVHRRFSSQAVTVESGKTYKIDFWVRGQGSIRTALFDERPGESGGLSPYGSYINVNSSVWTKYTQHVTAAKSTDIAEFIFSVLGTNAALDHIQIDNVSIEEFEFDSDVETLAELRNGVIGGEYTFLGEGVVTFKQTYRNQIFIQDATGGMLLDDLDGIISYNYALGDGISNITGILGSYLGMLQFQPKVDPGAPSSIGNPIIATNRTIAEVTSADQSRLIKVSQLNFTSTGTFATGIVYNISDPSADGVFRTNFFNADYIGNSIPSQTINLVAIVYEANGVLQLTARNTADFQTYVNVNNPEIGNITVYPNPFSNTLNFVISDDVVEVVMYNNMGQEYRRLDVSGNQLQVETSGMNSGIYFVRFIMNDGSQITKKLIKY
jgi:hypothetical protein